MLLFQDSKLPAHMSGEGDPSSGKRGEKRAIVALARKLAVMTAQHVAQRPTLRTLSTTAAGLAPGRPEDLFY